MAFKLQKYIDEAVVEPFPLELLDGTVLEIPGPDVDTLMLLSETPIQDNRRTINLLLGDHAKRVWEDIGSKPAGLAQPLVLDLILHFKIGNIMSVPGGSRASSS